MSYGLVDRTMIGAMTAIMRRSMSMPAQRDYYRQFRAEVSGVELAAPKVMRLTLSAPEFASYRPLGPDEYFGLYIPKPGVELEMPPGERLNPRAELAKMPAETRPDLRWYTLRRLLPERSEVWVDIVRHESGPGGAFLSRVAVGDVVGFREGTGSYPGPGGLQLLAGDETAVPAISAIAESLPNGEGITCVIELPSPDYAAPFAAPFQVQWVYRGDAAPGSALLERLSDGSHPRFDYAWVCGEQNTAKEARRLLVSRGTDKRQILFSGYWRLGHPRP